MVDDIPYVTYGKVIRFVLTDINIRGIRFGIHQFETQGRSGEDCLLWPGQRRKNNKS